MKTLTKILIVMTLIIFTGYRGLSQNLPQQDTVRVKVNKTESQSDLKEQGTQGNDDRQAANAGKNNASQTVKQVKGARPDMSKARGARPPSISRPSGSGIPKGIGKPGGVGRKGGR